MADIKNFKLIDGTFAPEEATEILNQVFSEKIKFHMGLKFGLYERLGITSEFSSKRFEELKQDKEELLELVRLAHLMGKKVRVNSDVYVEFVDGEPSLKENEMLDTNLK